ncbi:MAG TPA: ROK family protein [Segeticoccus sp.]|uniref:ROK family protein n=1 Tax=Segeticoccus sp. TaxID=2706531 RepID=UPI002D802F89|nr:ROK family protein [Segeticoccus sp.]HET8600600.1 ROK family protein [Segeticoccus sp.]
MAHARDQVMGTAGRRGAELLLGIDIGGTKTAAGLVDLDGRLLHLGTPRPTPGARGPDAVLATAVGVAREAIASRPAGTHVVRVGVGSAGVIDAATGRVLSATDALTGWAGTPVQERLTAALGVPVAVDNDVHGHALGEWWQGAGAGLGPTGSLLFVAVGTGVGASLVVGGRVVHGAHSVAGHAGHVPSVRAGDRPCPCGGRGHVESVAAGPAMTAEYAARTGHVVPGLADVVARAEGGDVVAGAVLAEGAAALGDAVGALLNVLDPDVVVLGGGVSSVGETWWRPMRAAAVAQALEPVRSTPLVPARAGAALLGAAWIARQLEPAESQAGLPAPTSFGAPEHPEVAR